MDRIRAWWSSVINPVGHMVRMTTAATTTELKSNSEIFPPNTKPKTVNTTDNIQHPLYQQVSAERSEEFSATIRAYGGRSSSSGNRKSTRKQRVLTAAQIEMFHAERDRWERTYVTVDSQQKLQELRQAGIKMQDFESTAEDMTSKEKGRKAYFSS